jgi:hypothetical protein
MRLRGRRFAPTTPAPMKVPAPLRLACAFGLFAAVSRRPLHALVRLNDGTDQIYVNGSYTLAWSSNVDAAATGSGDYTNTYMAGLEYQRRAGLIGVNAAAQWTWNRYLRNKSYDNVSPTYSLEFDKGTGRETGTLGFSATESSQSDAAANVHDVSWDYSGNLKLKYPIIGRYFFTGSLDTSLLDYTATSGQPLVNLLNYGASAGLFYLLSEDRDLFATYRYREEVSLGRYAYGESATDEALMVGVSGKVIAGINGSLSAGYQLRYPHGETADGTPIGGRYGDWTATGELNWAANRRLTTQATLSKDFATSSTNATTDTTAGTLQVVWAQDAHLSATAGVGGGFVRFLGPNGLVPGTETARSDRYFSWNAGGTYMLNSHFSATFSYNYLHNWSNYSLASFVSRGFTLTLSTRW